MTHHCHLLLSALLAATVRFFYSRFVHICVNGIPFSLLIILCVFLPTVHMYLCQWPLHSCH